MNLRIFFDSLNEDLLKNLTEPALWLEQVRLHMDTFPEWQDAAIAIIGVPENRGSTLNKSTSGPDEIRKKFYSLKKGSGSYRVADFGNLRPGEDVGETYLRLKEVIHILHQHNIVPVILGGSHDLDFAQYMAFEDSGKYVGMLNIDAHIDTYGTGEFGQNKHHIHRIMMHDPSFLFHYSHLGYQTYLCDAETLGVLEKLHFEAFRLGKMRENFKEMEPVIRNADFMSFDITAIKQTDAPGNKRSQPFGLSGEEACQICWYAGRSPKMSSVGFYEYDPEEDQKAQTAGVIATMLWYFLEGFANRSKSFDPEDPQVMKYIVSMKNDPHKLVFYKNNFTEEWWMEVPYPDTKKDYARNSIIPCSYNDYQAANNGEVPNRWILTHSKLI